VVCHCISFSFSRSVAGRYNDSLHTDARRLLLSSFKMGLCAGEFKAVMLPSITDGGIAGRLLLRSDSLIKSDCRTKQFNQNS
jgi:hypothetical protein